MVVARSPKGARPTGVAIEAADVSEPVQGIDRTKSTVALKGSEGNLVTTKVDRSVKTFETLKKGDSIHARYTEAIAIPVEKP